MYPKTARAAAVLLAALAMAGCDKVNKENYDKLKMGMAYPEVAQLLGDPAQCTAVFVAKNCTWGKEPKVVNISFVDDKVIMFSAAGL